MRAPSLRLRLLLVSAAAILVSVALAGAALALIFSNHVEEQLRADLTAQMNRLVALIDPASEVPTLVQEMPDPRFETPLGGLYWQVTDPASEAQSRSRSLWDSVLSYAGPVSEDGAAPHDAEITGPDGRDALLAFRRLDFELDSGGTRELEIIVAESTDPLDVANAGFQSALILGMAVLAAVLLVAAWLQVTLGLAPLGRVREGVSAVRAGRTHSLEAGYPAEIMPLVSEVNALLETQDTSLRFARERASDLAHSLKSALTALNAQAAAVRRGGNKQAAGAIETIVGEMHGHIDHQLKLARLRHRSRSEHYATDVAPVVERVVDTLRRSPRGEKIDWRVTVDQSAKADVDGADLVELLGAVIENASEWAGGIVSVAGDVEGESVRLRVEDDGPGVDAAALTRLGERGVRLDERSQGTGIGLAVAREIVELNGGAISFGRSALGGFAVEIVLPAMR